MRRHIWISIILIAFFMFLAWFSLFRSAALPFSYGLDLVGGTELVYRADTSKIDDVAGAMDTLKEVIERRVNIFGVSEPLVQTESAGLISGNKEERLIVELPGVKDLDRAIALIGKTPVLEFKLVQGEEFVPTELTGRYLSRAQVQFNQTTGEAAVGLDFNDEGKEIFARITREHKGEALAIVLDGVVLTTPVIQEEIRDGKAQITGVFSPEEAKELVRNLNYGALPVPIELATSQSIGATLGEQALSAGIKAGIIGFAVLSIFLIIWYRLPGVVAVVALASYIVLSLAVFKLIPVTLTAAGVAGFILSIGMAVDANILIFERSKEEMRKGKSIHDALHEGFHRAWFSIRDSNISSIITAIVLFWLGTSAVKGFALTLGVGVLVSMFTAITLSRTFLFAVVPQNDTPLKRFLFGSGLKK